MSPEKIERLLKKMRDNRSRMTNWRLTPKERGIARVRHQHAIASLTK